jgi:HTH-type transcriptional regulator/antitoxin HigA
MQTLKYKVITSDRQYDNYCRKLDDLVFAASKNKSIKEEIALLTLLIEKYDADHNTFRNLDPVELLRSLMKDHNMKAIDLAKLLEVSEGLVSDMLHYKKGLSKNSIRILAERFKLRQEAFSRPYKLKMHAGPSIKRAVNKLKAQGTRIKAQDVFRRLV